MSRRNSRTTKNAAISTILSFILMMCLICLSIFIMGKYSMFSVHAVMHCCDRIEYYEDINTEMTTIAQEKGIPYGIDSKHVKKVFDDNKIRSDMEGILSAQLDGEEYLVSTDEIRENIIANVTDDLGELDENQQVSLEAYVSEIANLYIDKMEIKGSKYFVPIINAWDRIITVGIPLCVFIAGLCIFFMISIRREVYRGLRYVTYSVLGAGAVLTTVFAASISDGFIYKFNISDVYMRKFYTYWIGHEMLMQVFVGIGCLLTGAILIYIIHRQKYRYK